MSAHVQGVVWTTFRSTDYGVGRVKAVCRVCERHRGGAFAVIGAGGTVPEA